MTHLNLSDMNWTSSSLVRALTTEVFHPEQNDSDITVYVFDLGPKRDPLSSVVPMTVIYVLIFISGLIGNVCTCVVVIRNKHMHTTTNYYLFSLAISDLLLLVMGLPQELYLLWNKYPYVFGEAFCIIRGFTSETSTNASILTITSFTIERYVAICRPLKAHTMSKLSRAIKIIVFVWIFGSICAVPLAIQFGIVYKYFEGQVVQETAECTLKRPLQHAFVISTFSFFILPMLAISLLYILIGIKLRSSSTISDNGSTEPSANHKGHLKELQPMKTQLRKLLNHQSTRSLQRKTSNSRKAVIKMLFAVVVAFFICWAPFHAQRLMAIYAHNETPTAVMIYTVLTYISGVMYYVSATINPILYSIMSNKFRHAFKNTLAHCCRRDINNRSFTSTYSNFSRTRSIYSNFSRTNSRTIRSMKNSVLENQYSSSQNKSEKFKIIKESNKNIMHGYMHSMSYYLNWKIFCDNMLIFKNYDYIYFKLYFEIICDKCRACKESWKCHMNWN